MSEDVLVKAGGCWGAPLCYHENSGEKFGFRSKDANSRYERAATQIPNVTLGPIPVGTFLEKFLPIQDFEGTKSQDFEGMPPSLGAFDKIPERCSLEALIYGPLLDALNAADRCPGFTFRDTSSNPDEEHGLRNRMAPDVCCYSKRHAELPEVQVTSSGTWKSRTFMGYAAFFIEVKKTGLDPFTDPPPGSNRSKWKFVLDLRKASDSEADDLLRALGQNATYATELFARQHRHCCFSIALAGSSARLIRWDRAGVIVTEAFDIRTPSGAEELCRFLWCFSHVGDADRGYDLTVRSPTLLERNLFENKIRKHAISQMSNFEDSEDEAFATHYGDMVSVVEVPDSSNDPDAVTDGIRRLVISRPVVYPYFLTGRATRAYWAVESGTGNVVFLKDTWRQDPSPCKRSEGETIALLHRKKVANVPPLICHADLHMVDLVITELEDKNKRVMARNRNMYQTTRTQEFLEAPWVCGRDEPDCATFRVLVRKRRHYRLVLGIAGRPFDRFNGSVELLKCTFDCFQAIEMAASKAQIGHRDITPENIIIYRKSGHYSGSLEPRQGYLVDWDIAWDINKPLAQGGFPFSATWQFVSWKYAIKTFPTKHEVQFDMESLLYVVVYCALLWLPNSRRDSLERLFSIVFAPPSISSVGEPQGIGKMSLLREGGELESVRWDCLGLQDWMDAMRKYYEHGQAWKPEVVAKIWREHLALGNLGRTDRLRDLPSLNGQEKNAHRRYLGLSYTASTVPVKRAFDHDGPTLAEISTTVDRNIRHAFQQTNLSSVPKQSSATPPVTTSTSTSSGGRPGDRAIAPTAVAGPSRPRKDPVTHPGRPIAGSSRVRNREGSAALPSAGPPHPTTHVPPGPSSLAVASGAQVATPAAHSDSPEKKYRSSLHELHFTKKKDTHGHDA